MKRLVIIGALILAACGADGEPEPVPGGITVTGEAKIGVKGTL